MRKMRDDSTWNQLTPEQREMLESWLFDENLGYAETLKKVQQEFGIEATVASLGRYYRRRARERQFVELIEAQVAANDLNGLPVSADSLREAAIKLVGKAVLRLVGEQPDRLEELASLTRLLLDSEDNDIRRSRLKLAERYFDYEATAACQKELPRLRAYLLSIGENPSLSPEEKLKRTHAVLFGSDCPKSGAEEDDKLGKGK